MLAGKVMVTGGEPLFMRECRELSPLFTRICTLKECSVKTRCEVTRRKKAPTGGALERLLMHREVI